MTCSQTIKYILGRVRAAQELANQTEVNGDRGMELSRSCAADQLSQHVAFELPVEVQFARLLTITLPKLSRFDKLALYSIVYYLQYLLLRQLDFLLAN